MRRSKASDSDDPRPVSHNVLSSNVLITSGLYSLTESDLEIVEIVKAMKRWALKWKITNIECSCQDCSECVL